MKRIGIFLMVATLIAGTVGCARDGVIEYDLTIASTAGGSVTMPGEGAFTYDEGEVVNLAANPAAGYYFVNWTGDVGDIANVEAVTTTVTLNDDYSIVANFVKQQYDLTTNSTANGLITMPGEGTFTYDEGEVVNLVAISDVGYRFVNWTGDVGTMTNGNARSTSITMNNHYSVTANFEYASNKINSHTGEYESYDLGLANTPDGYLAGDGCYDDVFIVLINNENAVNPSYSQLVSFLQQDETDQFPYIYIDGPPTRYYGIAESNVDLEHIQNIIDGSAQPSNPLMCCDFAERLHNNAEMAGIRCAYVYVKLTGYTDPYNYGIPYSTSHACNAFETTDRGLVYIDDTGLVADEPHPDRAVKTVSIVIGQSYTPVSLFHEADWEDSYNSMGTVTGLQVIWDGSWNN